MSCHYRPWQRGPPSLHSTPLISTVICQALFCPVFLLLDETNTLLWLLCHRQLSLLYKQQFVTLSTPWPKGAIPHSPRNILKTRDMPGVVTSHKSPLEKHSSTSSHAVILNQLHATTKHQILMLMNPILSDTALFSPHCYYATFHTLQSSCAVSWSQQDHTSKCSPPGWVMAAGSRRFCIRLFSRSSFQACKETTVAAKMVLVSTFICSSSDYMVEHCFLYIIMM